ncbi:MAG: SDR family NAD(P)-dependent oxidoreductase [Acidobacteriota bacterium]|nr:SDR family NAD(P)-dependent oxidoreductase [Acidobacteriota bacterium]
MSREFDDRHVVVTGGTGALGTAVIDILLRAGAVCHVPVRSERSAKRLPDSERVLTTALADLTDETAVREFYEGLPSLWASIHAAGGFAMTPIAETSRDDVRDQMLMNFVSSFLCSREAVRKLRSAGGGGRIVNVAARPAVEPRQGSGMIAYTASKAAVAAATEALAEEVAAEGIWVNAVAPSIMDTPANRAAIPDADFSRWPRVEDVATAIVFLASPSNRTARGSIVKVYGKSG